MLKIIKNFIWTVITLIILIAILIFTTNIYVAPGVSPVIVVYVFAVLNNLVYLFFFKR